MKGKKFHGGEQPNLADIEMYGMCSAFYGMPCWQDAIQNTKIEKWYNRYSHFFLHFLLIATFVTFENERF